MSRLHYQNVTAWSHKSIIQQGSRKHAEDPQTLVKETQAFLACSNNGRVKRRANIPPSIRKTKDESYQHDASQI